MPTDLGYQIFIKNHFAPNCSDRIAPSPGSHHVATIVQNSKDLGINA